MRNAHRPDSRFRRFTRPLPVIRLLPLGLGLAVGCLQIGGGLGTSAYAQQPASLQPSQEGWVARGMIGKRIPLSDPQIVTTPSSPTTPVASPIERPKNAPPSSPRPLVRPLLPPLSENPVGDSSNDLEPDVVEVLPQVSEWVPNDSKREIVAALPRTPQLAPPSSQAPSELTQPSQDTPRRFTTRPIDSTASTPFETSDENPSNTEDLELSPTMQGMLAELELMRPVARMDASPTRVATPEPKPVATPEPARVVTPKPGTQTRQEQPPADEVRSPEPLPIRRPKNPAPKNQPEPNQPENRNQETVSSPAPETSRGKKDVVDPNSRARDLQDQIERFERGEAMGRTPANSQSSDSDYDANGDSLDSAFESLKPLPKALPRAEIGIANPQDKPAPIISAAAQRLDVPIRQALAYYHQRPENATQRTPWGMLHAILPYGLDAYVDASKRYNAISYLAGNNPHRNLRMLTTTRGGRLLAKSGVGLQGHQAQMLAIFAQAGVPIDYPLYANNKKFSMKDLVISEMAACKSGEELTFTLIGLSHFLPTDSQWKAADGQGWNFERLLREELSQPIVGAACGGTHRLMGLSYALRQRRLEGLPISGQWARAETFINDFTKYAWQLQNRDGSFSTDWFEGRADKDDQDRKIQTTGHILEWLVFSADEEALHDARFTNGITFLVNNMLNDRSRQWQVGPKGHALRTLSLYHRRMFDSEQPWLAEQAVGATNSRAVRSR